MTMQRWDPFRELQRMEERMGRLWPSNWGGEQQWFVPLDVIETQDKIIVKASVPGFDADKLKVSFENGTLTIRGETSEEHEQTEGEYLVKERHAGSMFRSLRLPESVNADEAESTYDNGVLTIQFPKAEEKKAKTLQIKKSSGKSGEMRTLEGARKREAA